MTRINALTIEPQNLATMVTALVKSAMSDLGDERSSPQREPCKEALLSSIESSDEEKVSQQG